MLSLFIALILLLGMNAIFRDASLAVQGGNAVNEATRNARAVTPVFFNDLNNCAKDSPAFIISSSFVPQYLNKAEATTANAAAGVPPSVTGCILGDQLHRTDMLMFFARGLYRRKTANSPFLTSTTTSNEAYIHYGHLRVAADGITPIGPDDNAGVAEPYASSWVLGRNAILLSTSVYPQGGSATPNALDMNTPAKAEIHYAAIGPATALASNPFYSSSLTAMAPAANVAPLGYGTPDYQWNVGNLNATQVQSSRYDLAGVTIDQYRSIISNAAYQQTIEALATPYYCWWAPLVYNQTFKQPTADPAGYPATYLSTISSPTGSFPPLLTLNPPAGFTSSPRFRFQGTTVLSPNPMTSQDQANLAPFFLEHVSQFIVEYAGDFVTQNANGVVADTVPDGQIDWTYATKGDWTAAAAYSTGDFVLFSGAFYEAIQPSTNQTPPNATYWATGPGITPPQQIRWYGMPRDSTGSGSVLSFKMGRTANDMNNVVPLADIWQTTTANPNRPLPYEVELPGPTSQMPIGTDYASAAAGGFVPQNARYTAVWRNDVPAMVRILIKLDDPNNAVQDGPWYEYVFKLK